MTLLVVWWSNCCVATSANNFISGVDQQASSQYYRPYSYNRRPGFVQNQQPSHYCPVGTTNNYRPMTRPPTRPVAPQVSNSQPACSSTDENRNQGNWICWDAPNDKLRMGPNLSIENFVALYSRLAGGSIYDRPAFRNQICEQSRRFNNAGIVCAPYPDKSSVESYGYVDCPANAKKAPAICEKNV